MACDTTEQSICIYVVSHQDVPKNLGKPYRLLLVGPAAMNVLESSEGSFSGDVCIDGTGDSISYKNFAYCELTALYWIWKNDWHDVIGMVHYRRYLAEPGITAPMQQETIERIMEEYDLIIPNSIAMDTSVKEHFCRSHCTDDLDALYDVMRSQGSPLADEFTAFMESSEITPFNIFIGKRKIIEAYCSWLFDILDSCEMKMDLFHGKDSYQQRVFGFFAERLFGVWIKASGVKAYRTAVCTLSGELVEETYEVEEDGMEFSKALGGLTKEQLFDEEFYFEANPEVQDYYGSGEALVHYLDHGVVEGRPPSRAFVLNEYIDLRPELRSTIGSDPRSYYEQLAAECETRGPVELSLNKVLGVTKNNSVDYAPVYDWAYYTARYDDAPKDYYSTDEALQHFIEVGIPEGRQGSKGFDLELFKAKHPHLTRIFGDDQRRYYLYYILFDSKRTKGTDWRYAR